MSNASFCPVCGEMISDGCEELDEFGNETGEINYSPCKCDRATNPEPVIETRDVAAKAIQDVIKERTCFGIGIGVIREALDTAFPITVTPTNPAPVIETANGAVDIEPNPTPGPHHTTRRIAELNDVVSALAESNDNLVDNQGIHEAAIAELEKSLNQTKRRVADMDRDLMPLVGKVEGLQRRVKDHDTFREFAQKNRDLSETRMDRLESAVADINRFIHPMPEIGSRVRHRKGFVEGVVDDTSSSFGSFVLKQDNGVTIPNADPINYVVITPPQPQPTPPAAPDEDALWEQVLEAAYRNVSTFPNMKAAVAKAAALGLVPTPKIEVTQSDVNRAWELWEEGETITVRDVLQDFADRKRKNGGA